MLLWLFPPIKPRLLLKPENAMEFSEWRMNCMAECQACNRVLKSVDSPRSIDWLILNIMPIERKPFETLTNPRDASRPILNAIVKIIFINRTKLLLL